MLTDLTIYKSENGPAEMSGYLFYEKVFTK